MPQDFSKMSDQELLEFVKSKTQAATQPTMAAPKTDYSKMSDQELVNFVNSKVQKAVEGPSFGEQVADTAVGFGRTVDSYTGAPVRSAISELTRTTNEFGKPEPSVLGNIQAAGRAFANQVGNNPDLAPTGMDIAENRFGLSAKPILPGTPSFSAAKGGIAPEANAPNVISQGQGLSPAGAVGTAIDVGADLTNLIPGTAALRAGGRSATGLAKVVSKPLSKAGKYVLSVAEAGGNAIPIVGKPITGATKATANLITEIANPKIAPDYEHIKLLASKHGISLEGAPDSLEFGKDKVLANMDRVNAQTLNQGRKDAYLKYQNDVSRAFEKNLEGISAGPTMTPADAGSHMEDAFDRAYSDMMNTVKDTTYNSITKQYPGLALNEDAAKKLASKLNGIEKYAKGLVSRSHPMFQSQGKMLLQEVAAARNTNGSLKQAVEHLQSIGQVAFAKYPVGQIPPDIEKTRELYFTLRDVIYETLERDVKDGDAIAGALKISNDKMSEFFSHRDSVGNVLNNHNLSASQKFERIAHNPKQLESLLAVLEPQDVAKIKGAYLETLVKRNEDGFIDFNDLYRKMDNRKNKEIVDILFTPDEQASIGEIAFLGRRSGPMILNNSGTDVSKALRNMGETAKQNIFTDSIVNFMKDRARKGGISLPPDAGKKPPPILEFKGPSDFAPNAAIQLPKQMYIQRKNEEKRK